MDQGVGVGPGAVGDDLAAPSAPSAVAVPPPPPPPPSAPVGAGTADSVDTVDDGEQESGSARPSLRPDWWHREHPVFFPLAGFFTGMVYIVVVPGLFGVVLEAVVGYQRAREMFPFVLVVLVVPFALLVPRRTRRFGRYMVFGVVATAVVVVGVAGGVLWFLYNRDVSVS